MLPHGGFPRVVPSLDDVCLAILPSPITDLALSDGVYAQNLNVLFSLYLPSSLMP